MLLQHKWASSKDKISLRLISLFMCASKFNQMHVHTEESHINISGSYSQVCILFCSINPLTVSNLWSKVGAPGRQPSCRFYLFYYIYIIFGSRMKIWDEENPLHFEFSWFWGTDKNNSWIFQEEEPANIVEEREKSRRHQNFFTDSARNHQMAKQNWFLKGACEKHRNMHAAKLLLTSKVDGGVWQIWQ